MSRTGKRTPMGVRLDRRRHVDPITGCWEWLGAIDRNGYGRMSLVTGPGRHTLAYVHRVSWEFAEGNAIPDGRVVDHVCENRRCFNPAHLELVTIGENTKRRRNTQALRTHCPSGHRYAGVNLYVYVDPKGIARRYCLTCRNRRNAERAV